MKILLKGGNVVNSSGVSQQDILIENEKILKVDTKVNDEADTLVDMKARYIFPGFIDAHTHMGIPVRGTTSADNFESGSRAAMHGGVTTIIDFTVQEKGESLKSSLQHRFELALGQSSVDFSFHCNITDLSNMQLQEINDIVQQGIISFKVFTAYKDAGMQLDDRQILDVLWEVKQAGGTVLFHAENGDLIDFLTEKYVQYNKTEAIQHARCRPASAEIEAVSRILTLNQFIKCPIYFVHLTTRDAIQLASMAKQSGQPVFLETCSHYLIFDESVYEQENGYRYIAAPPFRQKEDIDFIWQALNDGLVDVVATDHCPFTLEQKDSGGKQFHKTPNGLPGVETLFSILYSEGVRKDRLKLERLVSLISEEPARLFALYPQKGAIIKGSDADLVIFNPKGKRKLQSAKLHSAIDWSPYEGVEIHGSIESVMLRGKWIIKNKKELKSNLNQGQFVKALL